MPTPRLFKKLNPFSTYEAMRGLGFRFGIPLLGCVAIGTFSCGKKTSSDSDNSPGPTPTPTATAVAPAPATPATAAETPLKPFWVASSSNRFLVRYDAKGARQLIVDLQDLTGVSKGGVTSLAFLDPTTLLAFVDPADDIIPEFIVSIDSKTGALKNKYWYQDSTNLKATAVSGMISGFIAKTVLIQSTKTVQRVLATGDSGTDGATFLSATALSGCTFDVIKNMNAIQGNNVRSVLVLSSGTSKKLNVVSLAAGAPTCKQSYDYTATGEPTSADDTPASAVQTSDGKIYVVYQHASASKIVSYDFDGTSLTGAKLVFQDQTVLGANPSALAARTNKRLLVSNPDKAKIYEVSTSGDFTGFLLQSGYVVNAVSILTED